MHLSSRMFQFGWWMALFLAAGRVFAGEVSRVPEGFLGQWAESEAACFSGVRRGRLFITTDRFSFPSSSGRVRSVKATGTREAEFEMSMSGMAYGRVDLRRFSLSDDLLTLHELTELPESTPVRVRCPGLPLQPVDEAAQDRQFHALREQLIAAVERRDQDLILSIVSPGIMNSFGGDGGIEEFKRYSRLEDPDSWFWKDFGAVLRLGGVFTSPTSFSAPYLWSTWPRGLDSHEHLAVIVRDARVRAAPSMDAPVIATLSHRTLPRVDMQAMDSEWEYVSLDDGRAGYIHKSLVRSHIGYRASFNYRDGRWWLDTFIAGD